MRSSSARATSISPTIYMFVNKLALVARGEGGVVDASVVLVWDGADVGSVYDATTSQRQLWLAAAILGRTDGLATLERLVSISFFSS